MRTRLLLAVLAAGLIAAAPVSAKTTFGGVEAHRGGALTGGSPSNYENSLEAYQASFALGADVEELDIKLTADNVPVVMHDATLDRTTNCTGQVRQKTLAELAGCRIDMWGAESMLAPAPGTAAIPTMADVLAWAKANDVKLNLEIKNIPTDPDYDSTSSFADTVLDGIEASGIPKSLVLVQSFWPPNLDRAKPRGFQTSLLVLQQGANQQAIDLAKSGGYDVLSPGWPPQGDAKSFVDAAHAAGKPVIPYTLDSKSAIQSAIDARADGFIGNDPKLGLRLFYGPACKTAKSLEARAAKKYKAALKRQKQAKTAAQKRKARAQVKSAKKLLQGSTRTRKATCARVPA
ncbi:MAG: glycerophosphoryl diester phosphodiesterase [Thermoleophilaceae bacterium]|nr:glycerophosphoryl diester phosphodiesterase [Thermoleophilaceae bacterium]